MMESKVSDERGEMHDLQKRVCIRIRDVDTSYPVIMDESGFIMDGWHRVMRAIADGKATIPAVRFAERPVEDFVKVD